MDYKKRIKLPEMAKLLSRSVKQFRIDVEVYNIPYIKLGCNKLFNPFEVEEYLNSETIRNDRTEKPSFSTPTSEIAKKQIKPKSENRKNRYKTLLGLR